MEHHVFCSTLMDKSSSVLLFSSFLVGSFLGLISVSVRFTAFALQLCVFTGVMDRLNSSPRLMIVSDLDHTMVDHHDEENISLLRFNALWESEYRHDSLLVFSTGRSPTLYRELRKEKPLLTPDITIMSVGTEITYGEAMVPDQGWEEYLNEGWDRTVVVQETARFPQLSLQPDTEQRPHKVSFYVQEGHAEDVTRSLLASLENCRLNVKIIYSGGQDLDILPKGAGKGLALAFLLKKFVSSGRLPSNTLACGDSGNDAELFTIPEVHGVMVKNAQKELLQWYADNAKNNPKIVHASERCAGGIIEAIGHFNLGPNLSPRDMADLSVYTPKSSFNPALEVVRLYILYERWLLGEMDTSQLVRDLKSICLPSGVMVHPSGVEKSLEEAVNGLEGAMEGLRADKRWRIWVDKVSLSLIGPDAWLVRFHKWESSGSERRGCVVTVLLKSKPESTHGFELVHLHETWVDGQTSVPIVWAF